MNFKTSDFEWLASQAVVPPKKRETVTLDELLHLLKDLKKQYGGDTLVYVRDEYEGHRRIKDVLKLDATESKVYID
jgi:hypothetical protein